MSYGVFYLLIYDGVNVNKYVQIHFTKSGKLLNLLNII